MRHVCSCAQRTACIRNWLRLPKRRRSSTSAGRSKVCRLRSNWPQRGRACFRARRLPPNCARAPSCCTLPMDAAGNVTPASRPSSNTPGACSANASARRWRGCRCSAAASRRRRRVRSAAFRCPCSAALVDKSLLRKEGARCVLHPLVQQFAHTSSSEGRDAEGSTLAHSRHFLRYLVERGHRVRHADPETLREIDTEFENIRAAWRFAVKHGPADDLARAAYSLMSYCDHRGRRLEGLELMHKAMEADCVASHPKFVTAWRRTPPGWPTASTAMPRRRFSARRRWTRERMVSTPATQRRASGPPPCSVPPALGSDAPTKRIAGSTGP